MNPIRYLLLPLLVASHQGYCGTKELSETTKIIGQYATEMCGAFDDDGSNEDFDISGETKANLNGLVKKLADLGLSGTAKYEASSYSNVLRTDLAGRLNRVTECHEKIHQDMKDLLISASNITGGISINTDGTGHATIIGDGNSTNITPNGSQNQ